MTRWLRGSFAAAVLACAASSMAAMPTMQAPGSKQAAPAWTSMFTSPGPGDSALYLAPEKFNHSLMGPVGTGAMSHWYAAQWNNPHELIPQAAGQFGAASAPMACANGLDPATPLAWNVTTPSAGICSFVSSSRSLRGAGVEGWQLLQDGKDLACGYEFDLFLSPTGSNYPGYPAGVQATPNLTSMAELRVSMTLRLSESTVTDRCGSSPQCGGGGHVDYGYTVLGLIGSATNASGSHQTLFYQVLLSDTRQSSTCSGGQDCKPRDTSWYFPTNPYGANDAIASFGQPCLVPGAAEATVYEFDALPLYTQAVQHGPPGGGNGFIRDPSQWTIGGVYLGVGIQGSVRQSLFVQTFDIEWR
jgi:hypothetical protein